MNSLHIGIISEVDLSDVTEVHSTCFDSPWSLDLLKTIYNSPRSFGIGVWEQKSLLAYTILRGVEDESEILSIGVMKDRRREGLAKKVLRSSLSNAQERGFNEIFLEVAEDNYPARNLYNYFGFEQVGKRDDYYRRIEGPDIDALTLKLSLLSAENL
tara:strand:- start:26207 stop:26677 length:471 start_codon:yes stop_codon:yes gene_type:complete